MTSGEKNDFLIHLTRFVLPLVIASVGSWNGSLVVGFGGDCGSPTRHIPES